MGSGILHGHESGLRIPPNQAAIITRARQELTVTSPGQAAHSCLVAGERQEDASAIGTAQIQVAGAIGGGDLFSVGAEGDRGNPVRVPGDLVKLRAGFWGIRLHDSTRPAEGHDFLVRAHPGGNDRVQFVTKFSDDLSGFHIIQAPRSAESGPAAGGRKLAQIKNLSPATSLFLLRLHGAVAMDQGFGIL